MPVVQNGPVTLGTRTNLIEGVRAAAMPEAAVDAVMQQAVRFTETLVATYTTEVATDEVGQGGSGQASDEPILAERPPRVLLYGRVQSGKTAGMLLTSALCLDNGFRVVVVLTTDNVALVKQTASRFKALDGPRVLSGAKEGSSYEWQGQEEQLRALVAEEGLVLVCAKNSFNLSQVIRFLQQIDAPLYPVLVLDDEADAATPDTTVAARAAGRSNAPAYASTINRLVIENDRPQEEGFSLGEALPHSMYVQVTATPYVLLLQHQNAEVRPTAHFLLEPGEGYCGGEVFFGAFDPRPGANAQPSTIVLVGDDERTLMRRQVPRGLGQSIDFFILSACARARSVGHWPTEGFKHLSHTSHKIDDHDVVVGHIDNHMNLVRRYLRAVNDGTRAYFAEAYAELRKSLADAPGLEDLLTDAARAVRQVDTIRVNSTVDVPTYGPRLNFVVGGNILGRGLTIEDLLVTYYLREAKTSQMDTVWQHARMYGYRRAYLDYMRVYLPRRLALRFKQIHEAEESLRDMMAANSNPVLIEVPTASRATRPNAVDAAGIVTVNAGRDQIFPQMIEVDADAAAALLRMLSDNNVPIIEPRRESRPTKIPFEAALQLVHSVPISEDDPGIWHADTIAALMQSFRETMNGECVVYVRELEADVGNDGRVRGRLGGPEIALLRATSPGVPTLALLYRGDPAAPDGWFPTLVMPAGAPAYVFTRS